jgi:hypothetical protein
MADLIMADFFRTATIQKAVGTEGQTAFDDLQCGRYRRASSNYSLTLPMAAFFMERVNSWPKYFSILASTK